MGMENNCLAKWPIDNANLDLILGLQLQYLAYLAFRAVQRQDERITTGEDAADHELDARNVVTLVHLRAHVEHSAATASPGSGLRNSCLGVHQCACTHVRHDPASGKTIQLTGQAAMPPVSGGMIGHPAEQA